MPRFRPARLIRGFAMALLASAFASGCEPPFQPFAENKNGPFSMAGYLDLRADTQWVRVMPIRQNVLAGPEAIDAVVTLERLGGGRTVTLRDSLFHFEDPRLGGVAYSHVFWTTERLEPRARYRVTATRSDGAASTAVVEMPADLDFSFLNQRDTAIVEVRADRVLFSETYHMMRTTTGERGGVGSRRQSKPNPTGQAGVHLLYVDASPVGRPGVVDARRTELLIVAVRSDWPYPVPSSNPALSLPDTTPSNVGNGLGYLAGVVTWTIPFPRCSILVTRPGPRHSCNTEFNAQSATISGRVIRQPCARPHTLADVDLTETFTDGGVITRRWKTGWEGEYRFEGIETGADLVLQLTGTPPIRLPRLAPGQRYAVPDVFVTQGC